MDVIFECSPGIFNHIYNGMLENDELHDCAQKWAEKVGVSRQFCPSLSFVGNHCESLLKKIDILMECNPPRSVHKLIDAFKKFYEVVKACFSERLDANFKVKISQFEKLYRNLGISENLKAHVLFDDIPRFLATRDHGLGRYSEQSIEAMHSLENNKWQNYKVDMANKNYPAQLLKSTLDLNGMNIK